MRLSQYYLPILKENPSDAVTVSHQLMLRTGMIKQMSSGIYTYLPLGLKVLQKISNIIRQIHNDNGCIELLMPTIQSADLWKESGRYDAYGAEMLRITDRHKNELLYGPTNEDMITDLFRKDIKSYKQLPMTFYQIQTKFRDEVRPRFGIMRGREFLMEDAYSFAIDMKSAEEIYWKFYDMYFEIFNAMGLDVVPFFAESGPIGGDFSHEFHVIAKSGESKIFFDKELLDRNLTQEQRKSLYAKTEDRHDANNAPKNIELIESRGIEVGQIFIIGDKYTKTMNVNLLDKSGNKFNPIMGCYGIGVSRTMAAIIEANHDDKGIIWPKEISPFDVSLINLDPNDQECVHKCEEIYNKLIADHREVLYDDADTSPGSKFATHDLLGFPEQIVVGKKTLTTESGFQVKRRMG